MTAWHPILGYLNICKISALLSFSKVEAVKKSKLRKVLIEGLTHLVVHKGRRYTKPDRYTDILTDLWLFHVWRSQHNRQPESSGRTRRTELNHLHLWLHLEIILEFIMDGFVNRYCQQSLL